MRSSKALNRLAMVLLVILPLGLFSVASSRADSTDQIVLALSRVTLASDPLAEGSVLVHLNGEVEIKLQGARPQSEYLLAIAAVSSSGSVQLGNLNTNSHGDGEAELVLSSGDYVGVFQVLRAAIVQYATLQASFTISSQTETGTTASATGSSSLTITVDPVSLQVDAGRLAEFEVHVTSAASEEILLSVSGVPDGAMAIFSPPSSRGPSSDFHSSIHVFTGTAVAGTYQLTLFAEADEHEASTSASLTIVGVSGQPSSGDHRLHLSLETDKHTYTVGQTVVISGHVRDRAHNGVNGAQVSIQTLDESGSTIFVGLTQTDLAGSISLHFVLEANAHDGVYTVFGIAAKAGFDDGRARTTFVVGHANSASITIREVRITNQNGAEQAVFKPGDTVVVWVVVENAGAALQGAMIWVQILDSKGVPISITISRSNLQGTAEIAVFITLSSNAAAGTYSVNAFVSDNLISKGGKFLDSTQIQFAVTS